MIPSQSVDLDLARSGLEEVVQRIFASGKITSAERLWFHQILLADVTLDAEMMLKVRQVFDRLGMGLLKVVD